MTLPTYTDDASTESFDAPDVAAAIAQAKHRAENLFETRALLCAEAVMLSLNETFEGPLTEAEAIQLGSTFCMGVGGAGCMCGALAGGVAAVGLLTANGTIATSNQQARAYGRTLHDSFVSCHRSSCCRVLSRRVKDDPAKHFAQCTMLTGDATERAARIIIESRGGHVSPVPPHKVLGSLRVGVLRACHMVTGCLNRVISHAFARS
ncbi:MAG: C-GCAxxG-C-C family protein [Desulfovibrionales bacterium]|nr:C-GCAxxG-C-C family protein [Desulfovibrionales bacterium]